jgi:curved DNA-binding protein CbpA
MRPLREQNFYELLEVPPDATLQEIARAYKIARSTYQPSSTATYSVFSDEENQEILRKIEESYTVLSDARLRREYDARLGRQRMEAEREPSPVEVAPVRSRTNAQAAYALQSPESDMELEESIEPEDGVYDGAVLRRIRLSRGVEIEEIAEVTKINKTYLRFIEEDRYHDLPAPVYVRGFLAQYARCLRLDPRGVTESYLERLRQRTGAH